MSLLKSLKNRPTKLACVNPALDLKKGFSLKYNASTSFVKSLEKGDFRGFLLSTTLTFRL